MALAVKDIEQFDGCDQDQGFGYLHHEKRTPELDKVLIESANRLDYTLAELGALLEDIGFTIEGHWGTFASLKDYKDELIAQYGEPGAKMLAGLRSYYDSNLAAILFAPLFPHLSRNCMWQLTKRAQQSLREFDPLNSGKHAEPWTSNEKWNELNA